MYSIIPILERDSAVVTFVLQDLYDGNMPLTQQCSEVLPTQRSRDQDKRMKGSAAFAKMGQLSGEQVLYKVIISHTPIQCPLPCCGIGKGPSK